MARGKYLSLEEARKLGKLDQFAKEHPSEGDGFARAETIQEAVALVGHRDVNVYPLPADAVWPGDAGEVVWRCG